MSSIVCGRCKTSLAYPSKVEDIKRYQCKCSLKVRILLKCNNCQKHCLNFPYLIRETNYCSRKCYWSGTNKKEIKTCKVCGENFKIKAYLIKQGYGLYCSKDCWFRLFKQSKKQVTCQLCKKEFLVINAVYRKHPKFCSKICKDEFERDYVSRVCKNCNQKFEIARHEIKRGRGSFCTWKCYKKFKGESSLELIIRHQLEKLNEPFQQEMRVGKFRADFYLPKRNLVIECDGEYWHMNKKIKERDQRKDKLFGKLGYNILRLNGQEIINHSFNLKNLFLEK